MVAPTSLLAAGAVTVIVAAAILRFYIDYNWGWDWSTDRYVDLWTWQGFLRNLMVNGLHPILPWFAFMLVGLWVGRQDLRDERTPAFTFFWAGCWWRWCVTGLGNIYPEGDIYRDPDQMLIAIDGWAAGAALCCRGVGNGDCRNHDVPRNWFVGLAPACRCARWPGRDAWR